MVQSFVSPPEWPDQVAAHLHQLKGNFRCEHPTCLVLQLDGLVYRSGGSNSPLAPERSYRKGNDEQP